MKIWDRISFRIWQYRYDRSAVTAVEYGVIAAAIVVGIVVLVYAVGGKIVTAFTDLDKAMK